jgi:hypothetical protein
MTEAKVERFKVRMIANENMISKERVVLPCGCAIYVGIRLDHQGAVTASRACSKRHHALVQRADELIAHSAKRRKRTPAVRVAADALAQAAAEANGRPK